jgi:hypothetical protein
MPIYFMCPPHIYPQEQDMIYQLITKHTLISWIDRDDSLTSGTRGICSHTNFDMVRAKGYILWEPPQINVHLIKKTEEDL